MAEQLKQRETENSQDGNVINLFDPPRPVRQHERPASDDEIAEYRKYWPLMKQMLREWEAVKASGGCPIAGEIVQSLPKP